MTDEVVPYNIYEPEPELPTEEEYRKDFNEKYEARIGAIDCVNKDTTQDENYLDAEPTQEGLAMRGFNRPFGALTRTEQNMILNVISGRRRELEDRAKTLRTLNTLDAHERVNRMRDITSKLVDLADSAMEDLESLERDDQETPAFRNQRLQKSRAGKATGKLKHIKRIQGVVKANLEISSMVVKLEEKAGTVFVKQDNDNRQLIVTPENMKSNFDGIVE